MLFLYNIFTIFEAKFYQYAKVYRHYAQAHYGLFDRKNKIPLSSD
jgi:hypothetical protein